jgi:hypothetical protein
MKLTQLVGVVVVAWAVKRWVAQSNLLRYLW